MSADSGVLEINQGTDVHMDKLVVVKRFSHCFMIWIKSIRILKILTAKEDQITENSDDFSLLKSHSKRSTSTPRSMRSNATDMFAITVLSAPGAPLLKT